jgi:16S rRNA (uracil1498-N3)-methyltransferase
MAMKGKAVHKEKHEFALFIGSLSLLIQGKSFGDTLTVSDEKLLHRMVTVLRLQSGEQCVFFDQHVHVSVVIIAFIGKKHIQLKIQSVIKNILLQPTITFLLPLLKRDDYESALYALAEVGVTTIQLIFTQKTAHQSYTNRDDERAQRILIAAAEQSKHFAYPQLKEPISIEAALKKYDADAKIFFDPAGKRFVEVMEILWNKKPQNVVLLIGPEGDLNADEKKIVQMNDFIFCALTPTIVRAVQAATLGAGFVRSLLFKEE